MFALDAVMALDTGCKYKLSPSAILVLDVYNWAVSSVSWQDQYILVQHYIFLTEYLLNRTQPVLDSLNNLQTSYSQYSNDKQGNS